MAVTAGDCCRTPRRMNGDQINRCAIDKANSVLFFQADKRQATPVKLVTMHAVSIPRSAIFTHWVSVSLPKLRANQPKRAVRDQRRPILCNRSDPGVLMLQKQFRQALNRAQTCLTGRHSSRTKSPKRTGLWSTANPSPGKIFSANGKPLNRAQSKR